MRSLMLVVRRDLKDRYPSAWAAVGEALAVLLSLGIYWYTARAFFSDHWAAQGLGVEGVGPDYFAYLVVGEATLFIPLVLFDGISRALKASASEGTLEVMLSLPIRAQTPLVFSGAALIAREAVRALLLIVAATALFGLSFESGHLALALQLLALPAFFGLGLLMSAIVLMTGRGDSLLSYVGVGASILAGTYFPVAVLPGSVQSFAALSPFTALLTGTRETLAHGAMSFPAPALTLLCWGAVLLPAGYLALGFGFRIARHRGSPLLFTS
jgi:ABC-2 type transport system permease protein